MPFRSQAHRRKFQELVEQGKMSKETFEAWEKETGDRKLPERAAQPSGVSKAKGPKPRFHRRKR